MCAWKEGHKCRDYILEIASQIAATYLGLRHAFREKAVLAISIRVTVRLSYCNAAHGSGRRTDAMDLEPPRYHRKSFDQPGTRGLLAAYMLTGTGQRAAAMAYWMQGALQSGLRAAKEVREASGEGG